MQPGTDRRPEAPLDRRRRGSKLSRKILLRVVVFSLFFGAAMAGLQAFVIYRQAVGKIQDSLEQVRRAHADAIAAALYRMDEALLRTQLQSALRVGHVDFVEVRERGGSPQLRVAAGILPDRLLLLKEFPLEWRAGGVATPLGSLTVAAGLGQARTMVLGQMHATLATMAAALVLAAGSLWIIVQLTVTRHLTDMARFLQKVELGATGLRFALSRPARRGRQDELDEVVAALNSMAERLETGLQEREQMEQALARGEEQLRQSQKMEALGVLAGGVAHDFNNLLTSIIGYAELAQSLLAGTPGTERARGYTDEIRRSGERAAELTRQLLAFSRKQSVRMQFVDLNALLQGMLGMLRRTIGEDISLDFTPHPGRVLAHADPGQIEMAVLNLAVNARDAMPRGGKLVIATDRRDVAADEPVRDVELPPGPYVVIRVSDTGCGIPPGILPRIFDPFFTTKEKGRGTGLGLSTVYGVVKQHQGQVHVSSEPGQGTTFTLYLRQALDAAASDGGRDERGTSTQLPRGSERVLLVDDDAAVRALAVEILRNAGYAVLEAGGPADGLGHLEHDDRIDLLVTDIVMPGMSGWDLARRARARRAGLPVLFISGYPDDTLAHHGVDLTGADLLCKPFSPPVFARRVREVLDRGRAPGSATPAMGGP